MLPLKTEASSSTRERPLRIARSFPPLPREHRVHRYSAADSHVVPFSKSRITIFSMLKIMRVTFSAQEVPMVSMLTFSRRENWLVQDRFAGDIV